MDGLESTDRRLFNGERIHHELRLISVVVLRQICKDFASISGKSLRSKSALYSAILDLGEELQRKVIDQARIAILSGKKKYARTPRNGRSTFPIPLVHSSNVTSGNGSPNLISVDENTCPMDTSPLLEDSVTSIRSGNDIDTSQRVAELVDGQFMKPPSDETVANAIKCFIEATNNKSLRMHICAICARELPAENITRLPLSTIPNQNHLRPEIAHAKHDLFDQMLLYSPAVFGTDADACTECIRWLHRDKLPRFALANNLWIGDIPRELGILTLPERILIAKYFPAAYIVKLYPKKKGARNWDTSQMHSGIRGNVSTYRLDTTNISKMIDGRLMPPGPKVLSATIGVTFVGPKNLPERTMPSLVSYFLI